MKSVILTCLSFAVFFVFGAGMAYDWQRPHAKVLPDGDLEWAPEAWKAPKLANPRYIDFADGDDAKDGRTPASAWKHHPNDPSATGAAKAAAGTIDGCVFKGGVVYRGKLTGALRNQTLCSLPGYGKGRATIVGSETVTGGWTRGGTARMPEGDKVWKTEVDHPVRAVWCLGKDGKWTRLTLARTPNWTYSDPDDVMAGWWQWEQPEWWTGKNKTTVNGRKMHLGVDRQHLKGLASEDLVGGLVWSEWGIVMGTPFASKIEAYEADRAAVAFQGFWYNDSEKIITGNRYFMEDRPAFLDTAGEFWFDRKGRGGTLYVRFPGDVDPKTLEVETSLRCDGLDLTELVDVRVTNLDFARIGPHWRLEARPFEDVDISGAAIRVNGSATGSTIDHCTFADVNAAIRVKAVKDDQVIEELAVTDNDIRDCDQVALEIGGSQRWGKKDGPYARTGRVDVLRNRVRRTGMRPARSESGHSVSVSFIERLHLAGNFVSRTCGAGIFVFVGKPDGDMSDCPYARVMIHHNKVEDPLLMANDWGGIETWQGGPTYVWANVSKNPGGYWNWAAKEGNQRLGFAYYLDGAFKNYHFDNVALGKSSDPKSKLCNGSALYQATPTVLNAFYNGLYRTFAQGSGWNPQGGRHIFAGNRFEDISVKVFDHKGQKEDAGHDYGGAVLKDSIHMVDNATPDAPKGWRRVKPFIPWSLARTVGEWNFRDGVPGLDEHWYMSPAMQGRFDYWKHPRNDLQMPDGVTVVKGGREDWIASSARFAGTPAVLKGRASPSVEFPMSVGTHGFTIESVFATKARGTVAAAIEEGTGFALAVTAQGAPAFRFAAKGGSVTVTGGASVADGKFHHVLAEIDRAAGRANVYVDGRLAGSKPFASKGDASTGSDLVVGKGFTGDIDFLRIAHSSLAESHTDIRELYTWEFAGPFLK